MSLFWYHIKQAFRFGRIKREFAGAVLNGWTLEPGKTGRFWGVKTIVNEPYRLNTYRCELAEIADDGTVTLWRWFNQDKPQDARLVAARWLLREGLASLPKSKSNTTFSGGPG